METIQPGALALALVADPESSAARALTQQGELTHGRLVEMVQTDLLGSRLANLHKELQRSAAAGASEPPGASLAPRAPATPEGVAMESSTQALANSGAQAGPEEHR